MQLKSDVLSPEGGPAPLIEWFVDGVKVAGASANSFTYQTDAAQPGNHRVTLRVKDVTAFVKDVMSGGKTVFEYSWTVNVTVIPIVIEEFQFLPLIVK